MHLTSIVAIVAWFGFLALGANTLVAELTQRKPSDRFRAANRLLVATLVISFTAGITRKSLWPFDSWPMFQYTLSNVVTSRAILGVDAEGREYPVDSRAWQPMQSEELISWLGSVFPSLAPASQDSAVAFLLDQANAARARATTGERVGYLDRFLGPFAAPSHFLHQRFWDDQDAVPPRPFVRLRIVMETWDVESGRSDPGTLDRQAEYEYPRDP